ncbi:ferredoxin [Bacilli bacterium PM5-9]|nr:ferredoxin [Bacilli bacterium PM5-9]
MERILLMYFSGTGMSKIVLDKLNNKLLKKFHIDIVNIENNLFDFNISNYDCLGIISPVHAFNLPKNVTNYLCKINDYNKIKTFIICSAAEDSKLNYGCALKVNKLLANRNANVFYNNIITMPSNFAKKTEKEIVIEIFNNLDSKIEKIIEDIQSERSYLLNPTNFVKSLSYLARIEQHSTWLLKYSFSVDNNCNKCLKCINNCPTKNIIFDDKIKFNKKCILIL